VRLFVAAELPFDLRERFVSLQEVLASAHLPVRWVRPEGIHLTLKFLGETEQPRLDGLKAVLREAGRDIRPFSLEAAGAVTFPERGAPRLIWVEVLGDLAAAQRLAGAIDAATSRIGFPSENREYRPHLTLGRVKGPGRGDWRLRVEQAGPRASGRFEVTEYVLFESRLGPGGAVYTSLERFALGRAAAGAVSR
jgi:2'-5' RNA ligase